MEYDELLRNASFEKPFDKMFVKPSKFDIVKALSIENLNKEEKKGRKSVAPSQALINELEG